ncbi:heme-binding protein [Uliginosibacterium sp. 31-12]|uniref:GlcG/HbpS family heme-binding protein n=1 Tax=Uliginosibacterium sp. 31-12 TaxID=3062781 RepID=UPI0026E19D9F|nr:heme-binding protein [Uliginosibacterium sp. 31-12]MDO6385117.1 heme-binding protein [Uliginosibacterium sp. 31-12]
MSTPLPPRYGAPITLEEAQRVMAAAVAECQRQGDWPMVIAIVDSGSHLKLFQALDGAQHASLAVAQAKAVTANNFRRPTKLLEEVVAGGGIGLRMLSMDGVCTVDGGLPLFRKGEVIGAIGVSGMNALQDAVIAAAAVAALAG